MMLVSIFMMLGLALPRLASSSLTLAAYFNTIEHMPMRIASEHFWSGPPITFVNGGVPNMTANASVHLAGNAQTQALRAFPTSRNLRIIYTIVEVPYRLVASRKAGISTLSDLRGKRIGTFVYTSGQYFMQKLLAQAGVLEAEYTTVNGASCNTEPCGNGTLPYMLSRGDIDAVALWEPTVELTIQRLGDDAVVFRDPAAYRELYNLHSTVEKLADPTTRQEIVNFVRSLRAAQDLFVVNPEKVILRVAEITGVSPGVLEGVWDDHDWNVALTPNMLQILVEEEQNTARLQNRSVVPEVELAKLIDDSIVKEALGEIY